MSTMADTKGRRTRRSFTEDYKTGAVRLVLDEGKTVAAAANQRRRHSTLGQISPARFERRASWKATLPPGCKMTARSPAECTFMKALLAFTLLLASTVIVSAALAQPLDGQISGVVVNPAGKPLADQRVELQRPSREGPGQVVATTDANGAFTYTRLRPGRYAVKVVVGGRVVATSGPLELSVETLQVANVTLALPAPPPALPPKRPRLSADRLLGGRPVPASLNELRAILDPGDEVVVRDAAGPKTRGRVSSISTDQVVIFQEASTPFLRRIRRPQERAFRADVVTRVDIVDSTRNGTLIGAAAGVGIAFGISRWEESAVPDSSNLKGLATVLFGGLSIVASSAAGHLLDLSINDPIYERPSQMRRVSFVPLLGRERIGLMARVHF